MCVPRALWRSAWLCKAPCRQHHRCPALWQRGRACCSATKDAGDQSEFQAWLRANPLPGSKAPPLAASADAVQPQPLLQAQRFHWSQAPAVAENCMLRHSQLAWALEAPGVLVACSVAGQPLVRLRLPRVLAGAQPLLFGTRAGASLQLHLNGGWPSPLHTKPEEESRSLLQALRHLAQQQPAAAAIDSWDCGGSSGQAALHSPSIGSQLLVLLSADSAALAIYQEGELVRHRVHTGYTVRRQQGKAQATYQRQGGGAHSVGGSIRARETRRLFQAAAATLSSWAPEIAGCNLLLRTGTERAWNELYHASNAPQPPVDRRDARWQAAGVSVRRPRLADAERVFAVLSYGCLEEG